jgi:hypothetical protein
MEKYKKAKGGDGSLGLNERLTNGGQTQDERNILLIK